MRIHWLPLLALLAVNFAVDRLCGGRLASKPRLRWLHAIACVLALVALVVAMAMPLSSSALPDSIFYGATLILYAYFTFYIPKYIYLLISAFRPRRQGGGRKAVNALATVAALGTFSAMWWGVLVTPTHLSVDPVTITSDRLPAAFDGYRIVQFSDTHLGCYNGDTTIVARYVDSINALHPDLIVFTGDLVSRKTSEAVPFRNILKRLHAPDGVLSILGNHDYDDYVFWEDTIARDADRAALHRLEADMGWTLLTNASTTITRGTDSIVVIGAENYGEPPFITRGSLAQAYAQPSDSAFKILLQHNPIEWQDDIVGRSTVDLTLAGHTHAMQVMVTIAGRRYSPACFRYPQWGGHYQQGSQHLIVNIGLGMVGPPMRIGATPELTLITLARAAQ